MRVHDRNLTGAGAAETGQTQQTQNTRSSDAARQHAADPGGWGDRIEFSNTIGQLSRAVSTDQSDRASRVQALAAQYQAGRYEADSLAISRSLIAEALGAGIQ